MRIYAQKNGSMNEADRLNLLTLLTKAGYAVHIGKEKPKDRPNAANVFYVEYSAAAIFPDNDKEDNNV